MKKANEEIKKNAEQMKDKGQKDDNKGNSK
jgi:hypothetical protein